VPEDDLERDAPQAKQIPANDTYQEALCFNPNLSNFQKKKTKPGSRQYYGKEENDQSYQYMYTVH